MSVTISRALVCGALLSLSTGAESDAVAQAASSADGPSRATAFFYAAAPPVELLSHFDRLVVEPDNVTADELATLVANGTEVYAYLSVGEAGPERRGADRARAIASLGRNDVWQSDVMDLGHPAWIDYLNTRADVLIASGYSGLFLDTLDSHRLVAHELAGLGGQEDALVALIDGFANRHPTIGLIANRGFEVLERVAHRLQAVAAESLFVGWDNAAGGYRPVPPAAREWLLAQLHDARERLGLEVMVLDYLPATMRDEARRVAADIAAEGFVPWVSTPSLDQIGVGALEVFPREVLMLYDSRRDGPQEHSGVHRYVAVPLEYAGYVPVYVDLAREAPPDGVLRGRYAAIVSWTNSSYDDVPGLSTWFEAQLADGVPLAMFGSLPVTPTTMMLSWLGVEVVDEIEAASLAIERQDDLIDGERDLSPRLEVPDALLRSRHPNNRRHLSLVDRAGRSVDAVLSGSWGGYALYPYANETDLDDTVYWLLDPYAFLETALDLPSLPMPDVTTRGGRRLWFAHIDGDALPSWAELPGRQLGAEVVETEILDRYQLPHTVSVVEAEMAALDEYADRRARMFTTIRRIFARADTELASHTFSHPFYWSRVHRQKTSGTYNLSVPDYAYSVDREVAGSVAFIDNNLAPAGKRTEVVLWSGDALPGKDALDAVDRLGLVAMNGGNTVITRTLPALSLVSPMARTAGDAVQIYAPIMNENVYTNDWVGPFDGFRRVIETLEMTDRPRRLKPLNIYYHFYIGTKPASLRSLLEVYDWSLTQEIAPIYASEYATLVPAFRRASVSRDLGGQWRLRGLAGIRSLRFVGEHRWPLLDDAESIAGARQLHDGTYLHTDGLDRVRFRTTDRAPDRPYLLSTNGRLDQWQVGPGGIDFRVRARVPVSVVFGGVGETACEVLTDGQSSTGVSQPDGSLRVDFAAADTGDARLVCDA